MKKSALWLAAGMILLFATATSFGQTVSDEAKRYFNRGMAAVELADLEAAIKEFEQATRLAPDWPDAVYNLGLVQEKAERYGDAVKSFRQYLRLAPNADDAEEVRSRIDKLEYKAIPELKVAKGFMGIPWGATKGQISEAMAGQGYRLRSGSAPDNLSFGADFEGAPFEIIFFTKNDSLYQVMSHACVRSNYPWVAGETAHRILDELRREYGPDKRESWNEKLNDGRTVPYVRNTWNLVDQRTSDRYTIVVDMYGTWFTDMEGLVYVVDVTNWADSLYERLKNEHGYMPLHGSVYKGKNEVADLIRKHGGR